MNRNHSPHPRALLTMLGALALLSLAACRNEPEPVDPLIPAPVMNRSQLQFSPNDPQLTLIGLTAAAPSHETRVDLPARLIWNEDRTQRIYAAFAGHVTTIRAEVGQRVAAGTVLASLASPDFGQAQADTARAAIDERAAQRSLQRTRELFDAGIVARKDLELAEADAERAQAESQRAHARTRLYGGGGIVNQQLALTAGIPGLVVERNINPGQELRPDQAGPGIPPLFVVTDPSSLWVQIDARESEAGTLRPGASFELSVPALPDEKFEGRVIAASDFIDPVSRTIKVRGIVNNADRRLKAEMLATASVERSLGTGVVVPAASVILRGSGHVVFVQVAPGTFEAREVKTGYAGAKEVLITRGLEVGEQVVSANTLLLAREFRGGEDVAARPAEARKP